MMSMGRDLNSHLSNRVKVQILLENVTSNTVLDAWMWYSLGKGSWVKDWIIEFNC